MACGSLLSNRGKAIKLTTKDDGPESHRQVGVNPFAQTTSAGHLPAPSLVSKMGGRIHRMMSLVTRPFSLHDDLVTSLRSTHAHLRGDRLAVAGGGGGAGDTPHGDKGAGAPGSGGHGTAAGSSPKGNEAREQEPPSEESSHDQPSEEQRAEWEEIARKIASRATIPDFTEQTVGIIARIVSGEYT